MGLQRVGHDRVTHTYCRVRLRVRVQVMVRIRAEAPVRTVERKGT